MKIDRLGYYAAVLDCTLEMHYNCHVTEETNGHRSPYVYTVYFIGMCFVSIAAWTNYFNTKSFFVQYRFCEYVKSEIFQLMHTQQ